MINRFDGTEGKRRLISALKECYLVEHGEALATKLAEVGDLISFDEGTVLMTQGNDDNDVYFLLVGEVDVLINNRHIAIRKARETVGEMAIINPTEPRSATLTARTNVVALKVTEPDFHKLADEHTHIWKAVANIVSDRLRQRSTALNSPNPNPLLFIGCAAESLEIAQEIQLGLKHDNINVVIWTDGIFGPSSITIDQLQTTVNESDFAVFVFSPDDMVTSRDTESFAPRDNTVFELGLFMGRLERSRTFIVKEHKSDVKIPTDLLGITPLTYVYQKGGNWATAVAPVCTELRKVIKRLGTR